LPLMDLCRQAKPLEGNTDNSDGTEGPEPGRKPSRWEESRVSMGMYHTLWNLFLG